VQLQILRRADAGKIERGEMRFSAKNLFPAVNQLLKWILCNQNHEIMAFFGFLSVEKGGKIDQKRAKKG
tara:strand:- start:22722 stop:22928 length:207 start_codon:yes stop_codon:yes gene_type:complete